MSDDISIDNLGARAVERKAVWRFRKGNLNNYGRAPSGPGGPALLHWKRLRLQKRAPPLRITIVDVIGVARFYFFKGKQ